MIKRFILIILLLSFSINIYAQPPILTISANGRYIEAGGEPIFLLGDTCWWGLKLSKSEIDIFLETRKAQGFNATLGWEPFIAPNRDRYPKYQHWHHRNGEGYFAFNNITVGNAAYTLGDITDPNDDFFDSLDYVIEKSAELDMYVGLIVVWNGWIGRYEWSAADIASFGEYYGNRYGGYSNVFWLCVGEATGDRITITNTLANAIHDNIALDQIFTMHQTTPDQGYNEQSYMDFDGIPGPHGVEPGPWNVNIYENITNAYARSPTMPVWMMKLGMTVYKS
ncbi:unnamed protein product, partial [marine sediment metagenome]